MVFYDILLILTGMYLAQEFELPNIKENLLIILTKIQKSTGR